MTFSAFEVETGRKLFLNGGDNLSVEAHKKIKAPMEINISEGIKTCLFHYFGIWSVVLLICVISSCNRVTTVMNNPDKS